MDLGCRVANLAGFFVKGFNVSYQNKKTLLFTLGTDYELLW